MSVQKSDIISRYVFPSPHTGQFYTSTMALVAVSIGMSVLVLNFNHRGPKAARAPKWMRSLLLGRLASKILFVGGAQYGKGILTLLHLMNMHELITPLKY